MIYPANSDIREQGTLHPHTVRAWNKYARLRPMYYLLVITILLRGFKFRPRPRHCHFLRNRFRGPCEQFLWAGFECGDASIKLNCFPTLISSIAAIAEWYLVFIGPHIERCQQPVNSRMAMVGKIQRKNINDHSRWQTIFFSRFNSAARRRRRQMHEPVRLAENVL